MALWRLYIVQLIVQLVWQLSINQLIRNHASINIHIHNIPSQVGGLKEITDTQIIVKLNKRGWSKCLSKHGCRLKRGSNMGCSGVVNELSRAEFFPTRAKLNFFSNKPSRTEFSYRTKNVFELDVVNKISCAQVFIEQKWAKPHSSP